MLLARAIWASRRPNFYGEMKAPDSLEGRFEVLSLHVALALVRLRDEPGARSLAQSFTDLFFRHIDAGLREAGVGDLTVPKRIRKLAGAFYGRLRAYEAAIQAGAPALTAALGRNLLGDEAHPFGPDLATYTAALASLQAGLPAEALLTQAAWVVTGP